MHKSVKGISQEEDIAPVVRGYGTRRLKMCIIVFKDVSNLTNTAYTFLRNFHSVLYRFQRTNQIAEGLSH